MNLSMRGENLGTAQASYYFQLDCEEVVQAVRAAGLEVQLNEGRVARFTDGATLHYLGGVKWKIQSHRADGSDALKGQMEFALLIRTYLKRVE
jgi:hypothetical protein